LTGKKGTEANKGKDLKYRPRRSLKRPTEGASRLGEGNGSGGKCGLCDDDAKKRGRGLGFNRPLGSKGEGGMRAYQQRKRGPRKPPIPNDDRCGGGKGMDDTTVGKNIIRGD